MKIAAFLLAVIIAATALPSRAQLLSLSAGRCETGDEVPAAERAPYENTALEVARAILDNRIGEAYARFAPQAREAVGEADFARTVATATAGWNPVENLRVAHSYRVSLVSVGEKQTTAMCTAEARGSAATPEGRVTLIANPVKLQAHVIVEGQGRNNRFGFVQWLAAADTGWQVLRVEMMPVSILDRSARELWTQAQAETKRGHDFNGYLLQVAALQLTNRGQALRLGISESIEQELKELKRPRELDGEAPFAWTFGDTTYRVLTVGPIGAGTDFILMIQHEVDGNPDDAELERRNQALIAGFKAARPEYAAAFDGLVVRAITDGRRRFWGTAEKAPPRK